MVVNLIPLGELATIVMGQAPSSNDCNFEGRGTPFVKVGEFAASRPVIREWTTNPLKMARSTDVLVCVVGATCGKLNLGEDCAIGRSVAAIRPEPLKLDQFYLHYFLMTLIDRLRAGSVGAAQTVISKEMIQSIPFPWRDLSEQRRIVAILDEAFEGIATAKANAEKNLQNAREVFENFVQSMFTLRGPGWTERTLEDVCEIAAKLVDPREPEYLDLPHIGAGNIESKSGAVIDVRTAREEQLISGKFLFDERAVLYSKIRPYLMKVVRPTFSGVCSADIYPLIPKSGGIDRDYLYHLLLTPSFTAYAIKGSARAGMPKVNRDHLFAYQSWLPPIQEQARLAARLDAVVDETQRLAEIFGAKLSALNDLKKSLLHQAFTGAL